MFINDLIIKKNKKIKIYFNIGKSWSLMICKNSKKKKKNDKKNYNRIANVQIRLSTYLYSTVIIQE